VSGSTTSATSPKLELPLPGGLNGTMQRGATRRSAIEARVSSVGYNINLWLDSGGALHDVADVEAAV